MGHQTSEEAFFSVFDPLCEKIEGISILNILQVLEEGFTVHAMVRSFERWKRIKDHFTLQYNTGENKEST